MVARQASLVQGISQAKILEWVAISFSRGSSPPRVELQSPALQVVSLCTVPQGSPEGPCVLRVVAHSCPTLCDPMDCSLPGSSVHADSPGKNTGVGCHGLLQGIFPTQELNWGLLHCRQILYQLSYQTLILFKN